MIRQKHSFRAGKIALLALALFNIPYFLSAQTQMKKWYLHGKQVDFTGSSPSGTTLPTTSTEYGPTNGIYDGNGNRAFYIDGFTLYDKNGTVQKTFPDYTMRLYDYAVVPFLNNDKCSNNKYYVFYTSLASSANGGLYVTIVDVNPTTGQLTITDPVGPSGDSRIVTSSSIFMASIAVGKVNNNLRNVYYVCGGGIYKFTLSPSMSTFSGIGSPSLILSSTLINGNATEADLSPDGTKLAWTAANTYYTVGLTTTGNYDNNGINSFSITGVSPPTDAVHGVEFSSNGNSLYLTTGGTGTNHGVYVKDLTSSSAPTLISGSAAYGMSQVELGYDGLMYVCSASGIAGINTSTNTFSSSSVSLTLPASPIKGYFLPDQIDGETYANIIPSGSITYDAINASYNSTATWTATSNPLNTTSGGVLKISQSLTFASGANIILDGLTLQFGKDATMTIQPGATVTLKDCHLQAIDCYVMWKGITVDGTGASNAKLVVTSWYGTVYPILQDAQLGIYANGSKAQIDLGALLFQKNQYDLKVTNADATNILVNSCSFNGSYALKDQSYGSNLDYDGTYTDKLNRSIDAITISNVTGTLSMSTNQVTDYQDGLLLTNASLTANTCIINNCKQYALKADAMNNNQSLNITQGQFIHNKAGLNIANGFNTTIYSSFFTGTLNGFSIRWRDNANRIFRLGDETNLSLKNTFDNCNWDAVNLYYNSGAATKINVYGNDFINQPYAKAINVEEPAGGQDQKYAEFIIKDNTINMGKGINLTNILGKNPNNPLDNNLTLYPNFWVIHNTITFSTQYDPQSYGIKGNAGGGLTLKNNPVIVAGTANTDWQNSAITIADQPRMLVFGNTCTAGAGLKAASVMLGSNYYCNTMTQCVNGIKLANAHVLRGDYDTHGIPGTGPTSDARHNTFNQTFAWGSEMLLGTLEPSCKNNLWVFARFKFSPKIQYAFPSTCNNMNAGIANYNYCDQINTGTGTWPPPGNPVTITGLSRLMQWKLDYYNEQSYRMGFLTAGSSNTDVQTLLTIEQAFSDRLFINALTTLGGWNPVETIPVDYKTVYTILANANLRIPMSYTSTEISDLTTIAQKNPVTVSPAAYSARAILWNETQAVFIDPPGTFNPNISGVVGNTCFDSVANVPVHLEKLGGPAVNYTVYTDQYGRFAFWGDSLKNVTDTVSTYRIVADLSMGAGTNLKYTNYKTIHDLAYGAAHYLGCTFDKWDPTTTGVADATLSTSAITVYPNPARDELVIQSQAPVMKAVFTNMKGQILSAEPVANHIGTGHLANGIYWIQLLDEKGRILYQQKLSILHD